MTKFDKLYGTLPGPMQNIALSLYGILNNRRRYNSEFWELLKTLEGGNPEVLRYEEFIKFFEISFESNYWRKVHNQYGMNFNNCSDIYEEIKKLPILDKKIVLQNVKELCTNYFDTKITYATTSGTTGAKLKFPQSVYMENKQWAVWWRYRRRFGIEFDEKMGWFGGKLIVPKTVINPPYWRHNYFSNQVMYSPIHLNNVNAVYYHEHIKKMQLRWLHGYPSQIAALAGFIRKNNLSRLKNIRFITTGAENLHSYQRELIEDVFQVPVRQHYGISEGVANISELPNGLYQADQDFSLVEFIAIEGSTDLYRVIGTNYSNISFPLFRYDTGDIVKIKKSGTSSNIVSFEGRQSDYLELLDGQRVGPMNQIFKNFQFVSEAQIVYSRQSDVITILIVPTHEYNIDRHEKIIYESFRERILNYRTVLKIMYVEMVERTQSGKVRSVIIH